MITVILCRRSIHLATINFQLLILAVRFNICKGLSVAHAVLSCSHICISPQSCPGFNIHFKLIWFVGFKTLAWWVFVWWWDDETEFGEKEKAWREKSLSKTSGKGDFIWFELQNKRSSLSMHSYSDPQTHSWFLDLFVVIKKLMCFSREIAGQVKSPYFKHRCIVYTICNKVFRIDGGGLAQVRSHQK